MRYARVEREARVVVSRAPDPATAVRSRDIEDRYLRGTRMRLRRVSEHGMPDVLKLGHKVRFDESDPSRLAHTTFYLDPEEYVLLAGLQADMVTKTRSTYRLGDGNSLAVDTFHDVLVGLVLAEVELADDATEAPDVLRDMGVDVTNDERFTGAALARTDSHSLRILLATTVGVGH